MFADWHEEGRSYASHGESSDHDLHDPVVEKCTADDAGGAYKGSLGFGLLGDPYTCDGTLMCPPTDTEGMVYFG